MKKVRALIAAVVLLCALPLSSCATTNILRWGFGETSIHRETGEPLVDAYLKPTVTTIWLPVAATWDVVTLPFQLLWGVYPYGEDYLAPPLTGTDN